MSVTIGIKALNEAGHIEAAIESALAAIGPVGGRVILADSGSTDDTIRLAQRFPVTIVQLRHASDRSCGAGAQLAFQDVDSEYFLLMDGDMTLLPEFLDEALAEMNADPALAGVGGHVIEANLDSEEFQIRNAAMAKEAHRRPGRVDRLDGGGLYRTAAIRSVGYFADRNLRSFEEFELAARLDAAGWKLARIDCAATRHHGHRTGGYRLLLYRLRSGQLSGAGAVVRSALGRPQLGFVLKHLGHLKTCAAILAWWAGMAAGLVLWWPAAAALLGVAIVFFCWRRGSIGLGLYSLAYWNLAALGMIQGLLAPRVDPSRSLELVRPNTGPGGGFA